jgi:hypothetical protein
MRGFLIGNIKQLSCQTINYQQNLKKAQNPKMRILSAQTKIGCKEKYNNLL